MGPAPLAPFQISHLLCCAVQTRIDRAVPARGRGRTARRGMTPRVAGAGLLVSPSRSRRELNHSLVVRVQVDEVVAWKWQHQQTRRHRPLERFRVPERSTRNGEPPPRSRVVDEEGNRGVFASPPSTRGRRSIRVPVQFFPSETAVRMKSQGTGCSTGKRVAAWAGQGVGVQAERVLRRIEGHRNRERRGDGLGHFEDEREVASARSGRHRPRYPSTRSWRAGNRRRDRESSRYHRRSE